MDNLIIEPFKNLKSKFQGSLIKSKDREYDEARSVWNGMIDKKPALIAQCASVDDVVNALNYAINEKLIISVRGGGHNVAGYGTCDGGIVIDLSLMNQVELDLANQTVRVGGGATWGEVDKVTQPHGLAVPGGVVSTTGIGGLTLGGGYGYVRRKYGLTCDNLLSVNVVTADGKVINAGEHENEDLFWGLRGGGGNFGIVTSFEFKLREVGPEVMAVETWYSMEDAKKVVKGWRDFMETAPDEVSAEMVFWGGPDISDLPDHMRKRPVAIATAVYCGDVKKGQELLKPLQRMAEPLLDLSGPTSYIDLQQSFDPFFPAKEQRYYAKSLFLNELSDNAIDRIISHVKSRPDYRILVDIWQMGGSVARVPEDETAYSGRSMPWLLAIDSTWDDPSEDERVINWSRAFWSDMHSHSSGGMYLNFPGLGEEKAELLIATYGQAKYQRLKSLKKKYDPENVFSLNPNIEPE
jgi:FAD/FMN-containing dehydrogenase